MRDAGEPPILKETLSADAKERLRTFVALLERWQRTHNLIGPSTAGEIWTRHVEDSLQIVKPAGEFSRWVDLGSGAGFPGLVVAAIYAGDSAKSFTLVESNLKKASFLRTAIRECGLKASVAAERIETFGASNQCDADIVSARALAPLGQLCRLAAPILKPDGRLIALKGQDFARENQDATQSWNYDLVTYPSITESGGCVAVLRNLEPKPWRS